MSDLEQDMRASLAAAYARDAEFVVRMRCVIDARPLAAPDAGVHLPGTDAAGLLRLAEEALRARIGLTAGPRGFLVKLDANDGRGRMTALVEFEDEDELRRAAAWLAADVVIQRAPPQLEAANEEDGSRQSATSFRGSAQPRTNRQKEDR